MKRLRWAIIGAPSSGKTYLLSDLIQAFRQMGFTLEPLPLNAPHSSFGSFFFETTNTGNGGMRQTEKYACRQENHYGAVLRHPRLLRSLHIDFLNIPGEAFGENAARLNLYFGLKKAISVVGKGVFVLTKYTNPAGRERLILEPSPLMRTSHAIELPINMQPVEIDEEYRRRNYLNAYDLYGQLAADRYVRQKSKDITGKTLISRFFEIEPDSVMSTLRTLWPYVFHGLAYEDYDANDIFLYFYPLLYSQQATDVILCDKLFKPSIGDNSTAGDSYEFLSLITQVSNFIEHESDIHPNAYLAFRGADFLLRSKEKSFKDYLAKNPKAKRDELYSLFLRSMLNELYGYNPSGEATGHYVDTDPSDGKSLTGMSLKTHLSTRFGADMGHGFWQMLVKSEEEGLVGNIKRSLKRADTIRDIFRSRVRPPMPPHVYFTSTPIDADFNIYTNDSADVSRFVYKGTDRIRSFHFETACNGVQPMCFGTCQLLADILTQNGVTPWGTRTSDPLLLYMMGIRFSDVSQQP